MMSNSCVSSRGPAQAWTQTATGSTTPRSSWSCPTRRGRCYEYPLIVDVDNDDSAEIVVTANNYRSRTRQDQGLRVLRDQQSRWVRTRRIWNQHTYHVTNINEDGTIPLVEENNWQKPGLNNYRQNVQGDGIFNAPDLVVTSSWEGCG